MAEETIDTGSKSDRKLMKDVGFSDELKKQLEDRIAQTGFATQNQRAASEVNMPVPTIHHRRWQTNLADSTNTVFCRQRLPRYRRRPTLERH